MGEKIEFDTYLKALNAEIDITEEIIYAVVGDWDRLRKANKDFYSLKILIDVCNKKLNGEIDDVYFANWIIVLCNLLKQDYYFELKRFFERVRFYYYIKLGSFPKKKIKELIAFVKDFDVKLKRKDKDIISCLKNQDYVSYYADNKMKVIYYREEFSDVDSGVMFFKCYIVDHELKIYNYLIADESELDFDLSKNYCKIFDEEKHEHILKDDLWYNNDEEDTYPNPEKRFCEAEMELQDIFCNEKYKLDKNLTL